MPRKDTPPPPPPWNQAPPGRRWVAQDMEGTWNWFTERPQPDTSAGRWITPRGTAEYAGRGRRNRHWHTSLHHRLE